jgi:hypothetical protein
MATELLATGSGAADSADLAVSAGAPVTVCLKGQADGNARVRITLKDDAGQYQDVGELTAQRPALAITAPGTYRFTRVAGSQCGVFYA